MEIITQEVHFSTISNIRDNAIINWFECDWLDLVKLLQDQGHVITEDKNVTCISPWLYRQVDENPVFRTTDQGELWTIDDKPVVARIADNVLGTSMLMFDFDATITVQQAQAWFADYAHFGYTSHSHRAQKKDGKDCFRVILPLKHFATADAIIKRRKAIYAQIPGLDVSCMSLARSFYIPSCPPDRKHLAYMWDNSGVDLFNVFDYPEEVYVPPLHTPVINRDVDKQKIIDSLKKFYLGNEPEWFNVAVAMASNDFTLQDFCEVTIGHLMHEKDEKKCNEKWKSAVKRANSGKTMTVGYLINLCKKHGAWEVKKLTRAQRLKGEK